MKTSLNCPDNLRGVFAVPPLCRQANRSRAIDFEQNQLVVRHIRNGGITRLLYGGNAFLYHISLHEYAQLLDWLEDLANELWIVPGVGPGFGRALDQAPLIRKHKFPCVMTLPCSDPRDVAGLEQGYREIAALADTKILLYLKDENNFGPDPERGLDAVARLVDDGVCIGIKYAVVREDPSRDSYLANLLRRVDPQFVISGIGERPAVIHLRDWKLPGFTTGSGCLAPRLSRQIFEACTRGDFDQAETLRSEFMALEDLRDEFGPARVLHEAVEQVGIARTGMIPPFVSELTPKQREEVQAVARRLLAADEKWNLLNFAASFQA